MRRALPVALTSALVLVTALAVSPIDAAAKAPKIYVISKAPTGTVSDPPPGHGSVFPVTVSGKLVNLTTSLFGGHTNTKLKKGSKLAKSARARCPVGGVTLGLYAYSFLPDVGRGTTVTDSSGAFSGVVQVNTVSPAGEQASYYFAGVQIGQILTKAGKIDGHPVRCLIQLAPGSGPTPHPVS